MASLIDDLVRRERDKYRLLDNIAKQSGAMLDPLREKQRFLEAISFSGINSGLKMREEMFGPYESALVRDFTAQLIDETTRLNGLLATERRAFTDGLALSSSRLADQIKGLIEPHLADQLKAFAFGNELSDEIGNARRCRRVTYEPRDRCGGGEGRTAEVRARPK